MISDKLVKGRKEKFQLMVEIYFDNKTPDSFEEGQYAVIAQGGLQSSCKKGYEIVFVNQRVC